MKQKMLTIILCVALFLTLGGCACEHEWIPADCLKAAICSKCEETGEPALGHDFAAATCLDPEHCTRCGETNGEALGHTYGEWVIGDETMSRSCTLCAIQETAEIDREVAFQQMLPGHWDFGNSWHGVNIGPYDLSWSMIPSALWAGEDGSVWFLNGQNVYEGVWEYDSYQELENGGAYLFHVVVDGEKAGSMHLMDIQRADLEPQVMYSTSDGSYTVLKRNDQLEHLLEGRSLTFADDGTTDWVTFEPGRVAVGNIGGEFVGTWHIKPIGQRYSGSIWEVNIHFQRSGETKVICFQIFLDDEDIPSEEEMKRLTVRALGTSDSWEYYRFTDGDTLGKMLDVETGGEKNIIGTWTSENLIFYPEGSAESVEKETQDYTLTFLEDGTFTAVFDKEYSGTWKYQKVEIKQDYLAYYDYPYYYYQVELQGTDVSMTVQTLNYGRINVHASDGSQSMMGWYNKTDDGGADHAALAPELIVGQWDAVEMVENTSQGTVAHVPEAGSYTLTVNPDGTFSMNMGGEVSGEWRFSEYTFQSGYCYGFMPDGAAGSMIYSIHTQGQLRAFYEIDGVHYGFTMKKR